MTMRVARDLFEKKSRAATSLQISVERYLAPRWSIDGFSHTPAYSVGASMAGQVVLTVALAVALATPSPHPSTHVVASRFRFGLHDPQDGQLVASNDVE